MKQYNDWYIQTDEDGGEFTATFAAGDFERWWTAPGQGDEDIPITDADIEQMYDAMLYVAEAEKRRITQTEDELREAIERWVEDWNSRLSA